MFLFSLSFALSLCVPPAPFTCQPPKDIDGDSHRQSVTILAHIPVLAYLCRGEPSKDRAIERGFCWLGAWVFSPSSPNSDNCRNAFFTVLLSNGNEPTTACQQGRGQRLRTPFQARDPLHPHAFGHATAARLWK